ncbi:PAS sensor protein [Planoprotostelium fungivorum]|uniref:Sugar transporter SWEET1 n=1 Tax=Planoprotostelium fungivorum TaxID=1890364 RepID=A0A2P6NLY0_9EUKA|nr:PAS sensor protein [Planoprotostelium fungivorum]
MEQSNTTLTFGAEHPGLLGLVSVIATFLSIGLCASPYKSIRDIQTTGTTGTVPWLPLFFNLFNSILASLYGYVSGNSTVLYVNTINIFTSSYFVFIYYVYSKDKNNVLMWLSGGALFVLALLYHISVRVDTESAQTHIGIISNLFTLCMFAAPLATMGTVIRTRDASSIIKLLAITSFACSVSWLIFGLMVEDIYIQLPNFVGLILSGLQIGLVYTYGARPLSEKALPEYMISSSSNRWGRQMLSKDKGVRRTVLKHTVRCHGSVLNTMIPRLHDSKTQQQYGSTSVSMDILDSNDSGQIDRNIQLTECIHQGETTTIWRAIREENRERLVVKLERGTDTNRLYKEWTFAKKLRGTSCIVDYEGVGWHSGHPCLVMKDEQNLFSLESVKFSVLDVVHIGLQIVDAIRIIHGRGTLHHSLSPRHILWDGSLDHPVKLIDFRNACISSKHRIGEINTRLDIEKLRWLPSEQLGRTNKEADYRADFYSFGAILYKLATGSHHVTSNDTADVIYAIMAGNVREPSQINDKIPARLNKMIMKLLSKDASDRYQSTYGIKYDLQLCLDEKTASTTRLAEKDIPTTFQPPTRIYGRTKEKNQMMEQYNRLVVDITSDSLILLSGASGVGKTSLVQSMLLESTKRHHWHVSTKPDQYTLGTPYSSLCQLIVSLLNKTLALDAEKLEKVKKSLDRVLAGKAKPLVDLLPEMEGLIGMQPAVTEVGPNECYNRLKLLFHTFLSTLAVQQGPIILYFDDIQWADDFSLKMMLDLSGDVLPQMILIMAYRTGELKNETLHLIDQVKEKRAVLHLELPPLSTTELSDVIRQKTEGNPFDISTFVSLLCDREILSFDHDHGHWKWDLLNVKGMPTMENASKMMTSRMEQLNPQTRSMLSFAAIAGEQCDLDMLTQLTEWDLQHVVKYVWPAVRDGFLLMKGGGEYSLEFGEESEIRKLASSPLRFPHDRVQRAAFDLISPVDLPRFHLLIARILNLRSSSASSSSSASDLLLFDCLTHYLQCESLLTDEGERLNVCQMCDVGAHRAASNSAYSGANSYASLGVRLLPENSWKTHYELSLRLRKILVWTEYLCERYDKAEAMYEDIMSHCQSTQDKISVCRIQIEQYEQQNRFMDCLNVGIKCLSWLSLDLYSPTADSTIIQERLTAESDKLYTFLAGRKTSDLYDLPEVTDNLMREAQSIFNLIWTSSYCIGNPTFCGYLSTFALNLSLSCGLSMESPTALCNFAFTRHDTSQAKLTFDLASLAISLLKSRFPNERQSYRCQSVFACGISPRIMPLSQSVTLLDVNFKVAWERGDVTYAAYICHQALTYRYYSGRPLREASAVYERHVKFLEKYNPMALGYCHGITSALRYHLGNDTLTEEQFLSKNDNILNRGMWYIGKTQTLIWLNDVTPSEQFRIVDTCLQFMAIATGYTTTETLFCACFVLLRCLRSRFISTLPRNRQEETRERIEMVMNHMREVTKMSQVNNQHKLSILEGMIAWNDGRMMDVISHLEAAAEQAREGMVIHYQALANELSAHVWKSLGKMRYADFNHREALRLYDMWGSKAKTSQLSKHSTPLTSPVMADDDSLLDMEVVAKSTKVVTADMNLEQMLDAMLKLVIQNSAAQRAFFLLPDGDGDLLLLAEGNSEGFTKQVIVEHASVDLPLLGIEIDAYIQVNQVKSIMCLPIVMKGKEQSKGEMKAVIYLDSSMSEGVFSEKRAKVVRIIASQMVVLLENAKFAQLLESERKSKELVGELELNRKSLEEFIDVLCHELRNPLNGIYGSKQLLEENVERLKSRAKTRDAEDIRIMREIEELTEAISISCDHLKEIVDTVLHSSKMNINAKQIDLREIPFRPAAVMRKVELMFHARMIEKGFQWSCNSADPLLQDLSVIGDPQRLSQILINLISNSVKFTEKGGVTVMCGCERLDEESRKKNDIDDIWLKDAEEKVILSFEVRDTGIGLTEEEAKNLFKRFSQANSEISGKYGGSGLGLNITKEIVERMGGKITMESRLGIGTAVQFFVLCRLSANHSDKAVATQPALKKRKMEVQLATVSHGLGKSVLVVEDNPINWKLLKKILEAVGYHVEVAVNGKEAWDRVCALYSSRSTMFHCILMDFEMPVMNGVECTQKIRQLEKENSHPAVPIIGVSANARSAHTQIAIDIGMNSYVTKPFQKQDIYTAIDQEAYLTTMRGKTGNS